MSNEFIEMIVNYICRMKNGSKESINSIVKNVFKMELTTDELFDLQEIVNKKCEEFGIICDYSNYNGAVVGLPFDIPFIKKDKKMEEIKELYFKGNDDYFYDISSILVDTFDYDILTNSSDNCIRFELYNIETNKKLFFAINKNMFLLNDYYKHKLNLRGNSSGDRFNNLFIELNQITSNMNKINQEDSKVYWGLTICNDNKCSLYTGKSNMINKWNELSNIINNEMKALINNTIEDIMF